MKITPAMIIFTLACSSNQEIPTQAETQEWFAGLMSEQGAILRQCLSNDDWRNRTRSEAERQQYLADTEVIQRMGQAAVDQGVEVKVSWLGEYIMTFQEEISEDEWRAIWPQVEAYKAVAERSLAEARADAEKAGCLG